jgi:hypothetical protein
VRIYEGTPQELHEFLKRQGSADDQSGSAEDQSGAISAEIERFVRARAQDDVYRRMIDYLTRVQKLGTNFVPGNSKIRESGQTNYIRVYADGPRLRTAASAAVAYVKPRQGALDLRLLPEDVADLSDGRIEVLQRQGSRAYLVRCHLSDDSAPDLAVELTERALDKLRG